MVIIVINTLLGRLTLDPVGMQCRHGTMLLFSSVTFAIGSQLSWQKFALSTLVFIMPCWLWSQCRDYARYLDMCAYLCPHFACCLVHKPLSMQYPTMWNGLIHVNLPFWPLIAGQLLDKVVGGLVNFGPRFLFRIWWQNFYSWRCLKKLECTHCTWNVFVEVMVEYY